MYVSMYLYFRLFKCLRSIVHAYPQCTPGFKISSCNQTLMCASYSVYLHVHTFYPVCFDAIWNSLFNDVCMNVDMGFKSVF